MGIQQRNLKIVFLDIQPEILYANIQRAMSHGGQVEMLSTTIGLSVFHNAARMQYPAYSYEEIANIHRKMTTGMEPPPDFGIQTPSVFYLLVRMGQRLLRQASDGVVCNFSETMAWRNISLMLGQDLFTTSFQAYEDLLHGFPPREEFAWDATIRTDNHRLHTILRKGIAENHCHLGGTTQTFPLSWACLMNFPQTISPAVNMLFSNLHPQISLGLTSNVWPWQKRLMWAQHLRLELFCVLEGEHLTNQMDLEQCFHASQHIRNRLETVRFCYGARIPQDGAPALVLDYALRQRDCANSLLNSHNRLLSGERSFLYRCFCACFDGTFGPEEQNWFYLYLLIKENFRAEIVQTNSQSGFHNFMEYQNRKDQVYESVPGYRAEAIRLAVNANQIGQHITSFEMRIAPRNTPAALRRQLNENERYIEYANGLRPEDRHFYVYHFIKFPDSDDENYFNRPRNLKVRRACRKQAQAIAYELLHSSAFCQRVFGIDAANLEIGCRPETFATEFRYLRNISSQRHQTAFLDRSTDPHIQATYHAGEDFLDIADGLRAIDEAVRFLELKRGDRIGHALAMGVDPEIHYGYKKRWIILSRQDFLDNIIWLLFRSEELGIDIKPQLRAQLESLADKLFFEIYGDVLPVNRYQYYCSMQLRGDAPELYFTLPYMPHDRMISTLKNHYNTYRERPSTKLSAYRSSTQILQLCQRYHFDPICRKAGKELCEYKISDDYIELMRQMQDGLGYDCAQRGIMIECNPTSNYLIGTFRRYDRHPIFRFNNARLVSTDGTFSTTPQLSVSINTDDQGIFDTTLENEYAIMACCLKQMRGPDGQSRYTTDSIYQYLDNIREMGLEQSFYTRTFHSTHTQFSKIFY